MKVSVLIKALNEEAKIAGAIESALTSIDGIDGEVVFADSLSTDRTVEIASRYPIRIVEFLSKADRSCGAGAQLAYQHSYGEYVYLLDGDMVLRPGFLREAIAFLDVRPDFAGVGGIVNNVYEENLEFRARAARAGPSFRAGEMNRLDCGGLYRRSALETIGYFSDRNLHSYEELDLGLRLHVRNGKLMRLGTTSVDHFTHQIGAYELLWKRMSSGYAMGSGELVRAALGHSHLWSVLTNLRMVIVVAFLAAWLLTIVGSGIVFGVIFGLISGLLSGLAVVVLPILVMTLRRRSLTLGIYSVASWVLNAIGFFRGLFSSRKNPRELIPSRIVREASNTGLGSVSVGPRNAGQ